MDLLERGRSLAELGKTMRWTDIRAFLLYAPPTSNYRRAVDPEEARREEYQLALMEPTNRLLGDVVDQLQWLRRGVPDDHGVIFRMLAQVYDINPDELFKGAVESHQTGDEGGPVPQKRQKSAAEIRAQLKAASRKS